MKTNVSDFLCNTGSDLLALISRNINSGFQTISVDAIVVLLVVRRLAQLLE